MTINWLTLLGLCLSVSALEIPINNCSLFTYQQLPGGQWIGLIQAPYTEDPGYDWKVTFVTRGLNMGRQTVSRLDHYPSEEENLANIRKGGRAQVFVYLEESMNRLPWLHLLELNNIQLCSNFEYESSRSVDVLRLQWPVATLEPEEPQLTTKISPLLNETFPRIWFDSEECGQEGFLGTQHGGGIVMRGQFPWLAAFLEGNSTSTATYKCVVSVISKRTVITAAHCIFGKTTSQMWVLLGPHDLNQFPEDGADLVSVSNALTPPDYDGTLLPDTDVGLLVLRVAIEYSRYIQPLCLWSSGMRVPANEGDTGLVAGWGYDETGEKTRLPKAASVQLVPRDQCLKKMSRAQDFITRRTVCAGSSRAPGFCLGYSGAALTVLVNNRWFIRGIVSLSAFWGGSCDLSAYVIYCDVSKHLDWIQEHIVV